MSNIFTFHGLGSSKQAFIPLTNEIGPQHSVHSYDFAGFGERNDESVGDEPIQDSIREFLEKCGKLNELVFIAHSMGSAVAIPLAEQLKHQVKAVIIIEGNLIGEDCGFLSRAAVRSTETGDFITFKNKAISKARSAKSLGWLKWINDFQKVREDVFCRYAKELVALSEAEVLLKSLHSLRCQKLYMYGDQYLKNDEGETPELAKKLWGISTQYIHGTSHFLLQDDPRSCSLPIRHLIH